MISSLKRKFILSIGGTIAVTLGLLFYLMYSQAEKALYAHLEDQSRAMLQQVVITRAWISEHEGIYIRRGPGVETNPFLPGTSIRDEQGREYIFHNPSLAIRRLSDFASRQGLYRFHMTSLNPINPANTPTPFEVAALEKFERQGYAASREGLASVLETGSGRVYLRIIPLKVEHSCLHCHEKQGYREGGIRGGVSVMLPMTGVDRQTVVARTTFALAWICILLIVTGTLYYLLRRLVLSPLRYLEGVAASLGAGSYGCRAILNTGDELERLAGAFNTMTDQIIGSYQSAVKVLAAAVEARDSYTRGHIDRVARYAVALGQELRLDPEMIPRLEIAAILHDIGKIGVPDDILRKDGPLTQEEIATMQGHALKGIDIVAESEFFAPVIPAILHHHEHFDGSGYPHGLRGPEIPLMARIIAVADAFDAMAFDRPYRKALPLAEVLAELQRQAGRQFDPDVTAALVTLHKTERLHGHETRPQAISSGP